MDWLTKVLEQNGDYCGNCGGFCFLAEDRRTIKACICGVDEYDIYDTAEDALYLP